MKAWYKNRVGARERKLPPCGTRMVAVFLAVSPLVLGACGETERQSSGPLAGAPAAGGTTSTSGGAPAGGSASVVPPLVPCGGDLTGRWLNINDQATARPLASGDPCWELRGNFANGVYSAFSRYPSPKRLTSYLLFRPDGAYAYGGTREGPITVNYAASCLVVGDRSPTCGELQAALRESGINEGWYRDALCTEQATGGCSCTIQVSETGGNGGLWKADAATGELTLSDPPESPQPKSLVTHYCVDDAGLRFDANVNERWLQAGGVLFSKIDCVDGVKGIGEDDIDCGGFCEACVPPTTD